MRGFTRFWLTSLLTTHSVLNTFDVVDAFCWYLFQMRNISKHFMRFLPQFWWMMVRIPQAILLFTTGAAVSVHLWAVLCHSRGKHRLTTYDSMVAHPFRSSDYLSESISWPLESALVRLCDFHVLLRASARSAKRSALALVLTSRLHPLDVERNHGPFLFLIKIYSNSHTWVIFDGVCSSWICLTLTEMQPVAYKP